MSIFRVVPGLTLGILLAACTEAQPPPEVPPPRAAPPASASAPAGEASGSCVLSGVVSALDGAPVAGALVAAMTSGGEAAARVVRTDREGRYCFTDLEAGQYGFTITAPGQTATYIDVRPVGQAGPSQAKLPVQVGGPGFVVRGLVSDDKGAPIAGARVYATRMSHFLADSFVVEAGPDGRYAIKLPEGRYAVSIRSETVTSDPANVDLTADHVANLTAQLLNPKASPAPDEVVAWVKGAALPLRTTEAGKGLDDMEPLRAIVGSARVVGLGEATHGTRDFFQMKHRMLELLVEKMGYRAFGIEASFADCLPLSEYVRTGKGDPAAALANQGFWTWDTEEVLAMVRWMRAWNEDPSHKEKLSFWGYDMQSPAGSVHALLAYFGKVLPDFAREIGPELELVDDSFSAQHVDSRPPAERAAVASVAKKIAAKLDAERAAYVKKTSARDFALARIHARVLADFTLLASSGDSSIRDRSMADVAAALLEVEELRGPGAKMVLWAHNGHISEHDNGGAPSMGAHLARRFGAGYVTFGFSFDEGSFQAIDAGKDHRGLVPFTVPSAPPGSLDHTLARAQIPLFALDLRAAPPGPVLAWLSRAGFSRSIGALFDGAVPDYELYAFVPNRHFDALFFVQKTTAARANETGKRTDKEKGEKKASPVTLTDPGFEVVKAGEAPPGWRVTPMPRQLEYKLIVSGAKCASGAQCLVVERTKGAVSTGVGTAATRVDATPYRGKRVRVSASARVAGKGPGDEAFLLALTREDAPSSAQVSGPSWQKVSVDVDVPADAERIVIGLTVTGAAKGGLDDLTIAEVAGK